MTDSLDFDNVFVNIGAMKCGTTSLHMYLGFHPQIRVSRLKELDFFVEQRNWKRGLDWYRRQLRGPEPVKGESSPNYTKYQLFPGVPERMAGILPNAKLIYLVRDPIKRLVSHYVHNVAAGRELRTLDEAVAEPEGNNYVLTSSYYRQLERYLPHYEPGRIYMTHLERMKQQQAEVLREVFRFLEVDEAFTDPRFEGVRQSSEKKRRPSAISRRLMRLPGGRYVRYGLRFLLDAELERPELSDTARDRLANVLHEDVERLRRFTGQKFPEWSV